MLKNFKNKIRCREKLQTGTEIFDTNVLIGAYNCL